MGTPCTAARDGPVHKYRAKPQSGPLCDGMSEGWWGNLASQGGGRGSAHGRQGSRLYNYCSAQPSTVSHEFSFTLIVPRTDSCYSAPTDWKSAAEIHHLHSR
ncbi:uncharacterized protein LOC143218426 isoform X1 [Lasioglossum baleicum]|uniref:uncharacterized protein LOC143218426 isoform X1 n=1 Tax=Lasioglossum baleicum TaxID=434251 RepID=UPI003FCE735E